MNYCSETGNCLTVDYERYIEDLEEKDEKISKLENQNEELKVFAQELINDFKRMIEIQRSGKIYIQQILTKKERELKEYD